MAHRTRHTRSACVCRSRISLRCCVAQVGQSFCDPSCGLVRRSLLASYGTWAFPVLVSHFIATLEGLSEDVLQYAHSYGRDAVLVCHDQVSARFLVIQAVISLYSLFQAHDNETVCRTKFLSTNCTLFHSSFGFGRSCSCIDSEEVGQRAHDADRVRSVRHVR